jgi:hypothetical protein
LFVGLLTSPGGAARPGPRFRTWMTFCMTYTQYVIHVLAPGRPPDARTHRPGWHRARRGRDADNRAALQRTTRLRERQVHLRAAGAICRRPGGRADAEAAAPHRPPARGCPRRQRWCGAPRGDA